MKGNRGENGNPNGAAAAGENQEKGEALRLFVSSIDIRGQFLSKR
jgi:hypothetical protein